MQKMRLQVAVAAVVATLGLAGTASAATLNDAAAGAWDNAATWGGSTIQAGDDVTIDEYQVNFYKVSGVHPAVPSGVTFNISGAGRFDTNYDTNVTASGTVNLLGGGTYSNQRGDQFSGGLNLNITGTNTYDLKGTGETSRVGGTTAATSTVIGGTGTLNIIGGGMMEFRAAITPTTASTFSGTYNIDAARVQMGTPSHTSNATVQLSGTVAGTAAATNYSVSPQLYFAYGGTAANTQPLVKNITGTGRVGWSNGGYYRDLAIGTLIDPGTASEAGLIKRHTTYGDNKLIMKAGSTMAFDVFSDTSADQIDWTSSTGTSGMVFAQANLVARLFTPSDATGPLSWTLILGDEWVTLSGYNQTLIADQSFASITFQNADGSTLTQSDGSTTGWKDLAISYGGTMGSSNRTVILSGEYVLVPEPGVVTLLAASSMLLGLRRRAS